MTSDETDERKRKRRPSGDEGAGYTAAIMTEVKRLRLAKDPTWSAERLAEEMAMVGVPWTRDVVVNLENGRRKTLAVHEVTALAYVLEAESPLELLAPAALELIPIAPQAQLDAWLVRQWFLGRIGALRPLIEARANQESALVGDIREALRKHGLDEPGHEGLAMELARMMASGHIAKAAKAHIAEQMSIEAGDGDG